MTVPSIISLQSLPEASITSHDRGSWLDMGWFFKARFNIKIKFHARLALSLWIHFIDSGELQRKKLHISILEWIHKDSADVKQETSLIPYIDVEGLGQGRSTKFCIMPTLYCTNSRQHWSTTYTLSIDKSCTHRYRNLESNLCSSLYLCHTFSDHKCLFVCSCLLSITLLIMVTKFHVILHSPIVLLNAHGYPNWL